MAIGYGVTIYNADYGAVQLLVVIDENAVNYTVSRNNAVTDPAVLTGQRDLKDLFLLSQLNRGDPAC